MAGDWIKMRGGLFSSPKLIAASRSLHEDSAFRDWLLPGGGGLMNGQLISDHALRCVTGSLLCVTWSWSREFGKALPNGDCLLPGITIFDLDGIGGAPGIGLAMEVVGWAMESAKPAGVILPNFFLEFNVPLTPAEKQKGYRERKKAAKNSKKSVTEPLPCTGNETVTREEKSIYKENKEKKGRTRTTFVPPTVDEVRAYCQDRKNGIDPEAFIDFYTARDWKANRGVPITDWKAAVRTWEKLEAKRNGDVPAATPLKLLN